MDKKQIYNCRVCESNSKTIELKNNFPKKLNSVFAYSYRNSESKSFFCKECGSLSFYNKKNINYGSGEYRKLGKEKSLPIDLPWSTVTYKRHIGIYNLIKNYLPKKISPKFKLLDIGGYNGFFAYGICQNLGIKFKNGFIADLDPNGLSVAAALGLSIMNLGDKDLGEYLKKNNNNFSLITAIHVLEHLEKPCNFFKDITKYISKEGIIYVEVPAKFFFPLSDPAHLTTFSKDGLIKLAEKNGFELIMNCFNNTPEESTLYGYPFSSRRESRGYIFRYKKKISSKRKSRRNNIFSIKNYIFLSLLSDLFLRLIMIKNYVKISLIFIKLLLKSILALILSSIIILFKIALKIIFLPFKKFI